MANKKFSKEVESLVRYVKDNMNDNNGWVIIRYRDVPKITGISSYYVRKIFELLKDHPNIIFEIDEEAKTNKKPLKFRYVEDPEEKINQVLTERQFYYLTAEEVQYIKETVDIHEYELLYKILNLCNYLSSVDAKEKPVEINEKEAVNFLLTTRKEFDEIVNILKKRELIIDVSTGVRLVLNREDLQSVKSSVHQSAYNKTSDAKHLDVEKLVDNILEKQGINAEAIIEEDDELQESNSLVENMKYFRNTIASMQDDFKAFLDKQIEKISESKKKEEEMNQGFETLQKLVEENKKLSEENENLNRENARLVKSLEASQKFRDDFMSNAEQRLEILLAEVIGVVTSYAKIPGWKKDQSANAKLQKNILNAVTAAVDDMLNFTKE